MSLKSNTYFAANEDIHNSSSIIEDIPSVKSILSLKKNGRNEINKRYVFFCERYLKCVIEVKLFRRSYKKYSLSTYVSYSDEAFALLLLENSETRNLEIEMIKLGRKPTQQDDDLFPARYTGVGKSKQQRGFTKKFKGWSVDGIARYNQLRHKIKSDRKYHGEEFDAFLLNYFKETTQLGGANDAEETDDSHFILAKNDLFDDDGDIEEICDDGDNQIESESFEEACLNFNDHIAQVRAAFDMDFVAIVDNTNLGCISYFN